MHSLRQMSLAGLLGSAIPLDSLSSLFLPVLEHELYAGKEADKGDEGEVQAYRDDFRLVRP